MTTYFKVNQLALVEDLKKLNVFIKSKSFIPYADYILFNSDGENLFISAMDIENTLLLKLRGVSELKEEFKICIENSFVSTLSSLDCDISFNFSENMEMCQLKYPLGEVSVPTMQANDFPFITDTGDVLFEINENVLYDTINKVLPFAHSDTYTSTNSIHFFYTDNSLRVGAKDNYSSCATCIQLEAEEKMNFMLSKKSAQMLLSVLSPESNRDIKVKLLKNDIIFSVYNGCLSCRKMEYGEMNEALDFYRLSMNVASREGDIIQVIDKKLLIEQIQRAVVFSVDVNRALVVKLERDKLTLNTENFNVGRKSIQEVIVNFNHKGKTSEFIVNATYFIKFLRSIELDEFNINIPLENGEGLKCIGQPLFCNDDGFIRLLGVLTY